MGNVFRFRRLVTIRNKIMMMPGKHACSWRETRRASDRVKTQTP